MKKLFVVLICLIFIGCAGPMKSVCTDLTRVSTRLTKAVAKAKVIHSIDPNAVTLHEISVLEEVRRTVAVITDNACLLGELLPD